MKLLTMNLFTMKLLKEVRKNKLLRRMLMSSNTGRDELPLHYGEIFGAWSYLLSMKGAMAKYQTLINHTGDHDLRKYLEDYIRNLVKPQMNEIENLLKANGIGLPPTPPERPIASMENIPVGARFNDVEIAGGAITDISAGLLACSQIMGQSLREDIAMMFGQFHLAIAQQGAALLRLNKDKGWVVKPPSFERMSEPARV